MIAYLILANLSLIAFYIIYHVFLRKLTFFQGNRVYLLSAVVLSFTLPAIRFIDLSNLAYKAKLMPAISLELAELSIPEIKIVHQHHFSQLNWNFELIYWLSISIAVLYFLIRLIRLYQRFNQSEGNTSFSFLSFIYIGQEAKHNTIIYRHELVHVQQGHSYDILLIEIVRIFNWFNPVLFFYIKELKFQHECIADQLCAATDKTSYAELLIANALRVPTHILSHEFASESILKKRIMMLFQNRSKKSNQWKYTLMIPIAGIIGFAGLVLNNTVDAKTELIKVIDVKLPVVSHAVSSLIEMPELEQEDKIYARPEVLPQPVGGMQAYMKYIGQNFKYTKEMTDNHITGTISVGFTVEKDGRVTHVKAKNDLGFGSALAAEAVVKNGKKWKAGIHKGKPVRVAFTLPIKIDHVKFPPPIVTKDQVSHDSNQKYILQSSSTVQEDSNPGPNTIFSAVEVKPNPPQGMGEFMKYIGAHYSYPSEALKNGINGVVEVSFIVEKDGSLSNVEIKKDLKYGTGQAAVDVIKNYPEKWRPGIQNGHTVRVAYTLPIRLNTIIQ
ncbi:TonB family protein [Sphingobacterium faecium]|jgi:TonB family protein|uniref:TonB family protein n=1 Tax=Sphingobacterium faecium TaxID=34087 RepID=UPI0004E5F3CE|nr:TonB family protein [Sphingobacterium faecium]UXD68500.1 M56 family metallopeptidase [Sphingobacterium faecium]WGQ16207.1 TonB family protein [Sphingobacterium faecium]CDT09166.1 putative TonB protein [Sphingobacterium sp. PM2-P1-29]